MLGRLAAFLLAVSWAGATAAAEPVIVDATPPATFIESFDQSAKVSGAPLVGLRLGSATLLRDNTALLGPPDATGKLCVRVTTKDGRYYADNTYVVEAAPLESLIRLRPLSVKYPDILRGYASDQVAIRAFVSAAEGCLPAQAVNLPVLDGPRTAAADLLVYANGKSQPARVALLDGDRSLADAACTTAPDGANIAYDLVCALPTAGIPAGTLTLQLQFLDGFGTADTYLYPIHLPSVAP
jgi:hypothetical protein